MAAMVSDRIATALVSPGTERSSFVGWSCMRQYKGQSDFAQQITMLISIGLLGAHINF